MISAGSDLFERITELPEYYPTRSELGILQDNAPAIASLFPQNCALIEFGSGSSTKTRTLLRAATKLAAYVPVDISGEFLHQHAAQLRREYPGIAMLSGRRRFHQAVRAAGGDRRRCRASDFSGIDHRQFRAARGVRVPAPCRPHARARARCS